MSNLDKLYREYRKYCAGEHLLINELMELILYDDGAGKIQKKMFCPTENNPFKVETTEILRFKTPGKGAKELHKMNEEGRVWENQQ